MKNFLKKYEFDRNTFQLEVESFRNLLDQNDELAEAKTILPFFKKNIHLAAGIANTTHFPFTPTHFQFEFNVFDSFYSDLFLANYDRNYFLFVEFENAKKGSLFKTKKNLNEWGSKVEHGISQILDWLWYISEQKNTSRFLDIFQSRNPRIEGLVVVGRDKYVYNITNSERLAWRNRKSIIDSQWIGVNTYDEILKEFQLLLV